MLRTGVTVQLSPADHKRLEATFEGRNSPQKQVWQLKIVLFTADGPGTVEIVRSVRQQDRGLALAGAVHGRGRGRPAARQNRPRGTPPLGD